MAQQQLHKFLEEFGVLSDKVMHSLSTRSGDLESIHEELKRLARLLSEIAPSIPSYELRKAQEKITELQSKLITSEVGPRSNQGPFKFTRKNRETPTPVSPAVAVKDPIEEGIALKKTTTNGQTDGKEKALTLPTIVNVKDQQITLDLLQTLNKDVWLDDLERCQIIITGTPNTLHITKLLDCQVVGGPVLTSIFLDGCQRSTFVFGCQQMRAHKSNDCDFYLYVRSRVIIEDCHSCRFAPYGRDYGKRQEEFVQANLDSVNNWDQIDDFNWLSSQPSPNWSIIPEKERTF